MEYDRRHPATYSVDVPLRSCSTLKRPLILTSSLAFSSDPYHDSGRMKMSQKTLGVPNPAILTREKMPTLTTDVVDPSTYSPSRINGANSYTRKEMERWIDYFSSKYNISAYGTKLEEYKRWLAAAHTIFQHEFGPEWLDNIKRGDNFTN